jgi:Putative Ice-binding-like adhesive domain
VFSDDSDNTRKPESDANSTTAAFYVTGDFVISGSGFVYIAPDGSFTLHVGTTDASGSDSVTISGNGVANGTQSAANFPIICLPSVKTVTYSGNSEFIGTLYAPIANLTMSGGSDGVGALVAKTVTFSGGMNFHYDECLGGAGFLKYVVMSWREL